MTKPALAAAAMAALLSFAHPFSAANAETTLCTEITALPITITVQGVYCLKKNLNVNLSASTSAAITINAGNVTIDFNGFRVNNQAPLATNLATGVYASDRKNITLRNGFIRGFYVGIGFIESVAKASSNHLVEQMKVADSGQIGIFVEGDKSVMRDNRVLDTGGGQFGEAVGILLRFADNGLVAGNTIVGVSETFSNYGLQVDNSARVMVSGNSIRDLDGGTNDRAIGLTSADQAMISDNKLLNGPGTGTGGIVDVGSSTNIVCRDNESAGFSATPFSGCDVPVDNVIYFF